MSREPWMQRWFGLSRWKALMWGDRPITFILGLVVGATIAWAILAMTGCGGSTAIMGGTTKISKTVEERDQAGVVRRVTEEASSTGASAKASGEKNAAEVSGTPAELTLPGGGSAKGGGFDGSAASSARFTAWGLIGVGVAAIMGAGAAFYFGLRRAAIMLAVGGAAFITIGLYPGLMLWFLALAAIGAGVYLYSEYGNKAHKEALRAVAAGVADVGKDAPDLYAKVKNAVASHADAKDRAVIDAVKREDNL